jgi:uncharacterized protein YdeI (BOF family)
MVEEQRQFQKRKPTIFTTVDKLNKDMIRICLVGTIVSRNETISSFALDDGTGTITVILNDVDKFDNVKDGQIVRVFGKIWGEGADIEIQGDLVQDFTDIDLQLFKKVFA